MSYEDIDDVLLEIAMPIFFCLATIFLWRITRIAKIENGTFAKALMTVMPGCVVGYSIIFALSSLPMVAFFSGLAGCILTEAVYMVAIYKTSFRKSLRASVFSSLLSLVALFVILCLVTIAILA